jgi:hypothetical protein
MKMSHATNEYVRYRYAAVVMVIDDSKYVRRMVHNPKK